MFKIVFWLVRRYVLRRKKEATLIYNLKKMLKTFQNAYLQQFRDILDYFCYECESNFILTFKTI